MEHGTQVSVLEVEGTLRAPMNRELGHRVEALLCRGERRVVLDLVRLTDIDAAGVGELVGAFNMTNEAEVSCGLHVRVGASATFSTLQAC